jgi:hypothetical protein
MTVMPITEIINEIDAYLSRLRQARELLLDRKTEAPQKGASRPKSVTPRRADPTFSHGRRANKSKSRLNHPMAHLKKETERVEAGAAVPSSVTPYASGFEQPPMAQPERDLPQSVAVRRLPSKGPDTSIRSVRSRNPKSTAGSKPDAEKPAIALAGPAGAKIVVVPAEQLRRERERAAQPAVPQPPKSGSGLTGRLAFEALFKKSAMMP